MSNAPLPVSKEKKKRDLPKHAFVWTILLMELLPFYMMLQISVKSNDSFKLDPWFPSPLQSWEWANYTKAIGLIGPYIANTIFVAVTATVLSLAFALMASYFFARYRMPLSGFFWAAYLLLMLMPGVANIVTLFSLLKSFDLLNTLWALIAIGIAGGQVFQTFILRNFIEDLPSELFEAAEMDGAGHFHQILHVVIPLSGSILGTLFTLSFLGQWNEFLMPLIILRDPQLYTLGVGLIYLDGEYVKDWGKVMAAFFTASIPLIIIFLFTMKLFVKGLSAGAVKG